MKRLLAAMLGFGVLAACREETIVLATYPDEDDAGDGPRYVPPSCIRNEDCTGSATSTVTSNEFCQFDRLDPVPTGHCKHKPIYCDDEKAHPVCGSNGITYVNDCYRKQAGVSSKTDGECPSEMALHCDPKLSCPIGATCELLGGGSPGGACGPPSGHCWGLIGRPCHDDDDNYGDRWDECSNEIGALRCVSACQAIMSGRTFAKAAFGCKP